MMLWNQKDLPQPPINTYKSLTKDIDLMKLRNALQTGIKHFKEEKLLSSEAAILSRILYRMKMKFRSGKHFKLMERLKRCLDIYFNAKIARHLQDILNMTPKNYERETYLPTRNMLCFILVKLQGLVKLMERLHDTCLIVAEELNSRLLVGHFWHQILLLFALISRIFILVKFNTKFLCELYGKLLPHSHKLANTGQDWLPKGYILPQDLRMWLSVEWVYEEEFVDLTFEPSNEVVNFFSLIDEDDDDEVQFCDEYILLDDEDKQIMSSFRQLTPIKDTLSRNGMRGFSLNEDDIGEEITEIIELNDTVLEAPEEALINTSLDNVEMEDIGKELEPSNLSKRLTSPNKARFPKNLTDSNKNIDIVIDTEGDRLQTDDSSVIVVLDDTVNKENAPFSTNTDKRKRKNVRNNTNKTKKKGKRDVKEKTPKKMKKEKDKSVLPQTNIKPNTNLPESSIKAKSTKKKTRRSKKHKQLLNKLEQETQDDCVIVVSPPKTNKKKKSPKRKKKSKQNHVSTTVNESFSEQTGRNVSKTPKKNNSSPSSNEPGGVLKQKNKKITRNLNMLKKLLNTRSTRKRNQVHPLEGS